MDGLRPWRLRNRVAIVVDGGWSLVQTSYAAFKASRLMDVRWCQPKLTGVKKHLAGSNMLRRATVRGFNQHYLTAIDP